MPSLPLQARATVKGEPVVVGGSFAQMFALVVHELATNAAKHGSLSTPRGHVIIGWKIDRSGPEALLSFSWAERGGPPVGQPKTEGLGTQLMTLLGKSRVDLGRRASNTSFRFRSFEAVRGTEGGKPFGPGYLVSLGAASLQMIAPGHRFCVHRGFQWRTCKRARIGAHWQFQGGRRSRLRWR